MKGKDWRLVETKCLYGENRHKVTVKSKSITDWLSTQPSTHVQKELAKRTWYIDDTRLTYMVLRWA
jgi:hypothetical protein